jgi:hypothetical protein
MRTIKFTEQMDWNQSIVWIEKNRKALIFEEQKIVVDFSSILLVHSNMLGFIINLITTRKKNNLETEIIPPTGGFMSKIFKEIGV